MAKKSNYIKRLTLSFLPVGSVLLLLAVWEFFSILQYIPRYIAPSPIEIITRMYSDFEIIVEHSQITLVSILVGFISGMLFALIMSFVTASSSVAKLIIEPILITSQVIPKIALAPLLIIVFGTGIESRALVAALISFFPFYSNTLQGLYSVNNEIILQSKLAGKSKLSILFTVRFLYSIPYIVAAAKSSVLLAVIGVIVGEFLGANTGLGFLILDGSARFDTTIMFSGIMMLSLIGALLYIFVSFYGSYAVSVLRLNK